MTKKEQQNRFARTQRGFIQSPDGTKLAFHNRKQERAFNRGRRLRGLGWTRRASTNRRRNVGHQDFPNGIRVSQEMAFQAQTSDLLERFEYEQQVAQNVQAMKANFGEE